MLNPKEEYVFLKDVNNIKDLAYDILFTKYIVQNVRGDAKKTEIESTDQESIISSLNGGFPIPGLVYTFIYGEPDQINLLFNQKNFIDVVPLVFCLNITKDTLKGINFNMLPNQVRLSFLSEFYSVFSDFFTKKAEELAQNNLIALNKRFIEYVKSGKGQELIKIFNRKTGNNFNYAYRSYIFSKIKRFRMIEYNEWLYIPFYDPKDAFREMNQKEIHKLYYRK